MEDPGNRQSFVVTVEWSEEADARLTEGDVLEVVEELVIDMDEDAVVEVMERMDAAE